MVDPAHPAEIAAYETLGIADAVAILPHPLTMRSDTIGFRCRRGRGGHLPVLLDVDLAGLLDEVVALKLLRAEALASEPTLLERFKQEIKLARRITRMKSLVITLSVVATSGAASSFSGTPAAWMPISSSFLNPSPAGAPDLL